MMGSKAEPSTAGAGDVMVTLHSTLERTVTETKFTPVALLRHFSSVVVGSGPLMTEIVVFIPSVSFDMARMRGAMIALPEIAGAVKVIRNEETSDGFTHAHVTDTPETAANVIANRSAEMETPPRFGRMVHDSERDAETRDRYESVESTKLSQAMDDVVSGAAVMTMMDTADDPIERVYTPLMLGNVTVN